MDKTAMPRHIGIIMDGNGRWAKKRGLPRSMGHRPGAKVFSDIAKYCRKIGVSYLTVYAFSTENWARPEEEIREIMNLLRSYLKEAQKNQDEDVCMHFLGDRSRLDRDIQQQMAEMEQRSRGRTGIVVNVAINYGGREELVKASKELAELAVQGKIRPEEIDEKLFSDHLYTAGMPDVDLLIRPSGEKRTSNFLPWQTVYAEMVFMDVLWPDFTSADLDRAIEEYGRRNRRFGGV